MPEDARLQRVPQDNFTRYRDTLSGLTDENTNTVREKLAALGVLPQAGTSDKTPMDVDQRGKRGREDTPSQESQQAQHSQQMITDLQACVQGLVKTIDNLASVMTTHVKSTAQPHDTINLNATPTAIQVGLKSPTLSSKPAWAEAMPDRRSILQWDSEQYVAQVGINGSLALAVVDTGSCKTLICTKTAAALGLEVNVAKNGEHGTYRTPGGALRSYYGVVRGELVL